VLIHHTYFQKTTVVEFHLSWSGSCDCVKPMLYRVSLEKEEIKFVTAVSDQVCQNERESESESERERQRRDRQTVSLSLSLSLSVRESESVSQ